MGFSKKNFFNFFFFFSWGGAMKFYKEKKKKKILIFSKLQKNSFPMVFSKNKILTFGTKKVIFFSEIKRQFLMKFFFF